MTFPNIRRRFGALTAVAALVLLTACAQPADDGAPVTEAEARAATATLMRMEGVRPFFLALEQHFPRDAADFRDRSTRILKAEEPEQVRAGKVGALVRIMRNRQAERLWDAPLPDLLAVLDTQIALFAHLDATPGHCAALTAPGSAAAQALESDETLAALLGARDRTLVAAARAGVEVRKMRVPPDKGVTRRFVDAVDNPGRLHGAMRNVGDWRDNLPGVCGQAVYALQTLRDTEFEGRDRMLADFLVETSRAG